MFRERPGLRLASAWAVLPSVVGSAAALMLNACASRAPVTETLGPDSYMVTVQSDAKRGGYPAARATASSEAEALCAGQGKVMLVTHLDSGISAFLDDGAVQLNFRCLAPDDPLVAPQLQ